MTGMFAPYAIYRNRVTGATSHNLRAVLPKRATVNPGFVAKRRIVGPTLFDEVEVVAQDAAAPGGLANAPAGTLAMDRATTLRLLGLAIAEAIYRRWDTTKFHLVFHSSGYDSRIISAAILWLRRLCGDGWLGDVLFVCLSNECDLFEDIMRFEGWPEANRLSIRDVSALTDKMIAFDSCGRWLNGPLPRLCDYNYILPEYLREIGAIPAADKTQIFSGRNEILMGATMPDGNRLGWSLAEAYDSYLALSRYSAADVVFPFGDLSVVGLALASNTRFDWSTERREEHCGFRRGIGDALLPGLATIPRTNLALPDLSDGQRDAMLSAYRGSWYARVRGGDAPDVAGNVLDAHPWWPTYTAAALCEALRREGWELNVRS